MSISYHSNDKTWFWQQSLIKTQNVGIFSFLRIPIKGSATCSKIELDRLLWNAGVSRREQSVDGQNYQYGEQVLRYNQGILWKERRPLQVSFHFISLNTKFESQWPDKLNPLRLWVEKPKSEFWESYKHLKNCIRKRPRVASQSQEGTSHIKKPLWKHYRFFFIRSLKVY